MPEWPFPMHDPYPAYRAARERAPVQYSQDLGAVLVLSRSAATSVLRDPAWSSDPRNDAQTMTGVGAGTAEGWARSMLLSDGDTHARLRSAITGFFTPRAAARIRARVTAIVDAALEPLHDGEDIDVMTEVAYPVPVAVISELFDIGVEGAQLVRDETPDLARTLEAFPTRDDVEASAAAAMRLMLFLVPLVAERRGARGEDLLSALIGSGLDTDEVITTTLLLLAAGHETTANLIGNGALALLEHPDALAALRARPQLGGAVVEEVLRYDSPVQVTRRAAAEPITLDGVSVASGTRCYVVLGAANRDGDDGFRVDRRGGHVAFGHGPHFCAGAGLARLEAGETLTRLAPFLTGEWAAERNDTPTFRRLRTLGLRTPARTPASLGHRLH